MSKHTNTQFPFFPLRERETLRSCRVEEREGGSERGRRKMPVFMANDLLKEL